MRRNNAFPVRVIYTRNELADAVNANAPFIDIQGETKAALIDEIEKNIKKNKREGKINAAIFGMGAIGLVAGAALWVPLLYFANGVLLEKNRRQDDFSHYRLAAFKSINSDEKLALINTKEYDPEYDTVIGYEDYLFTNKLKCPKCGKKFNKKELTKSESTVVRCGQCYKLLVFY